MTHTPNDPAAPLGEAGARLGAAEAHMIVRTLRPTDEGSWAVNELFIQKVLERFADALLSAPVVSPPQEGISERERAAIDLLKRLYGWDVMDLPNSDGAYWRSEIMKVVAPIVPPTAEDIAWGQAQVAKLAAPVVPQEGESPCP